MTEIPPDSSLDRLVSARLANRDAEWARLGEHAKSVEEHPLSEAREMARLVKERPLASWRDRGVLRTIRRLFRKAYKQRLVQMWKDWKPLFDRSQTTLTVQTRTVTRRRLLEQRPLKQANEPLLRLTSLLRDTRKRLRGG